MSIFEGKSALIIEDDASSVRVLEQLLKQVNMSAIYIPDGTNIEQKLEMIETPDIVFLDLEMPVSNGYTVLKIIQSLSKFDDVPVVAYTTHISHLNDVRKAGFHSFLGKPINGREFPSYLERIFNGEHVWEVPG